MPIDCNDLRNRITKMSFSFCQTHTNYIQSAHLTLTMDLCKGFAYAISIRSNWLADLVRDRLWLSESIFFCKKGVIWIRRFSYNGVLRTKPFIQTLLQFIVNYTFRAGDVLCTDFNILVEAIFSVTNIFVVKLNFAIKKIYISEIICGREMTIE